MPMWQSPLGKSPVGISLRRFPYRAVAAFLIPDSGLLRVNPSPSRWFIPLKVNPIPSRCCAGGRDLPGFHPLPARCCSRPGGIKWGSAITCSRAFIRNVGLIHLMNTMFIQYIMLQFRICSLPGFRSIGGFAKMFLQVSGVFHRYIDGPRIWSSGCIRGGGWLDAFGDPSIK